MRKDFIDGVEDTKLSQNAYIVFDSPAAVKAAVESGMSGADLFGTGHIIRLDYIGKSANKTSDTSEMVSRKFDRKKSIYIPHVPSTATEFDITKSVESIDKSLSGTVRGVRLVKTKSNGSFAYVLLSERVHATCAIKACPVDGIETTFPNQTRPTKLKFIRMKKEDELEKDRKNCCQKIS
jgi:hypothetical protein